MTTAPPSGLPAYGDYVSQIERADTPDRIAARWPFAALLVVGALLILAPLVTVMFPRAIQGEAMIDAFRPYVSEVRIDEYRADLRVLADARANVLALREQDAQPGQFDRVDQFVRDYPGIDADITGMLDGIDANQENFRKLADTTPFGTLPWLLALSGVALIGVGVLGLRSVRHGKRGATWHIAAALVGIGLIALPITGGLFQAAPAAQPLLDGFAPILTQEKVRTVQGYFVTLVAADGEIDSRYVGAVRAAHPDADLAGITALQARWQPMTSRFAGLVGVLNDNLGNFDSVVALNDSTQSLGFTAFRGIGWGFLIPGVLVLAASAAGLRPLRTRSGPATSTGGDPI